MKYKVMTCVGYVGTENEEILDGDYENEEEAIKACFGNYDGLRQFAIEEQGLEFWLEEVEEE